jgi:hypothetical protein
MSNIRELPVELREHIYKYFIRINTIPSDLKDEIESFKLMQSFRNIIGILGFRNAAWGVVYHVLTKNTLQPVRYRYVNYEPKVFMHWDSMTNAERDSFRVPDVRRGYYDDDGSFIVEWWNLNEFLGELSE